MSNREQPVASTRDGIKEATGGGGITNNNNIKVIKRSIREKEKTRDEKHLLELRSRFGEAFLPYIEHLESVEKPRVQRKRRGKNIRKQPTTLSQLPKYSNRTTNRINEYNDKRDNNVKK